MTGVTGQKEEKREKEKKEEEGRNENIKGSIRDPHGSKKINQGS